MTSTIPPNISSSLLQLKEKLEGELHFDALSKTLYATDASVYREIPLAVAFPKSEADIQQLILFAKANNTSLIPRTAGTSLAGQCVGNGIVVDVSRFMNKIIEFNPKERWVLVQPGVIRDELNVFLKPHGLFFSPITSTANRAMIGGMVGNNSSGTTSIVYGTTRDKVLGLKTLLSDGSEAYFGDLTLEEFEEKCLQENLEGSLYRQMKTVLSDQKVQQNIAAHFPKKSIHRRNTGYAVDALLATEVFTSTYEKFNFCKLLSGSEGTLAFSTEIKLLLDPLPAPFEIVVAAHFETIHQSMKAAQVAMKHQATAVELMDKIILDCTKESIEYSKNRYFVEGDPMALLMIEFRGNTLEEALAQGQALIEDFQQNQLGYAFPVIGPDKTKSAWALRSAGLGLLANIPGDPKAVACIEDTAVDIEDLADYIDDFDEMLKGFGQEPVHYAHAGAGEIHIRPILDLKKTEDREAFFQISEAAAKLVKKYNGSLSGEHGDGRVRAPFIPLMVGEENYQLFKDLKNQWDPHHIFNPGKIVDAAPMNTSLRYEAEMKTAEPPTLLDFSETGGILRLAEKCNGSGDCRKTPTSGGGTMCPSYQATRNEKDTTRGRANVLREFLTKDQKPNAFDHPEIKEALDLCLSCKGCTAECPSNVDMASMKAEFLYQYQKANGVSLRSKAFAYITQLNQLGAIFPSLSNLFLTSSLGGGLLKKVLGVAAQRNLPAISRVNVRNWVHQTAKTATISNPIKKLYLFLDEFTAHNDAEMGMTAVKLLRKLGYEVILLSHEESGRSALSKGLLEKAKKHANVNVKIFGGLVSGETPLVGIEPSAILSFRDEYPRLVDKELVEDAKKLKFHTLLIDEFIGREIAAGNITSAQFTHEAKEIKIHGHCHQKALSSMSWTEKILSLPENYTVKLIPSGCCGMAGSFGYEEEHYEVSMKIGEMVLFPEVRNSSPETIIAATGTSCRHQIADGTGRNAKHPVEILFEALKK
jgi:FAD/FMN-containing dehydrogenase/Fe-S oxidoreductase